MFNIKAYVDGSYDNCQKMYGSGAVLLIDGITEPVSLSEKGNLPGFVEMRNIGGELNAVCIDFVKVKAHSNNKYNNMADKLAGGGITVDHG
jgi:ribonuclease HI